MAQNHVSCYTLRLFHTFAIFEKSRKIDAKREAKSHVFSSKNAPWAHQGRLRVPFWSIFEDSKNRRFFDVAFSRRKIDKNRSLDAQGLASALRGVAEVTISVIRGPRAAANYQRNR